MKKVLALLLVALIIALSGCMFLPQKSEPAPSPTPVLRRQQQPTEKPVDVDAEISSVSGYAGPAFSGTTLAGDALDDSYIQGQKLTMVNFWATWCPPCVEELPALAKLHDTYASEGFGILGVMLDEDTEAANALIESSGIRYPIILVSGGLAEMASGYQYVPTTVFFDSQGNPVGQIEVGGKDYDAWSALVTELLGSLS